ncbi:hypothetical protein Bca101_040881 [Brassica carinata]
MRPHDVPTVTKLLRSYLRQFKVSSHFEEAEVTHWFLPRDEVVYTYVVVNPQTDPVTDFFSFFARHSSPYKLACSFYHVTSETSIQKLMRHALIVANENGFYTFIALDIMGNKSFFKKPSPSEAEDNKKKQSKHLTTVMINGMKVLLKQRLSDIQDLTLEDGPIVVTSEVKQEPYSLPSSYEWIDCDLNSDVMYSHVADLLTQHFTARGYMYTETYNKDFLRWHCNRLITTQAGILESV